MIDIIAAIIRIALLINLALGALVMGIATARSARDGYARVALMAGTITLGLVALLVWLVTR